MNNIKNKNLDYSFQLNENKIINNINKKLKKNNNNGNINLNLNKGDQFNFDMNINNMKKNINYNVNNTFFQNYNNNHNIKNNINNKASLRMQGLRNTMPNFNLNENLNFSMKPGKNQQLLNNQRSFYNPLNYLLNGNIINNFPNSSEIMRNEKYLNLFQQKDSKFSNSFSLKKKIKQFNNNFKNKNSI